MLLTFHNSLPGSFSCHGNVQHIRNMPIRANPVHDISHKFDNLRKDTKKKCKTGLNRLEVYIKRSYC